jgi:uncharacterized membrane protein
VNDPVSRPSVSSRRLTSATMTSGVLVSAACFAVAIVLELAGGDMRGGRMSDVSGMLDALVAMEPWAWAGVGTYVLIVTPVVALVATIIEYGRGGNRAAAGLAVLVLLVLLLGCLVAVVR